MALGQALEDNSIIIWEEEYMPVVVNVGSKSILLYQEKDLVELTFEQMRVLIKIFKKIKKNGIKV